MLFELYIRFQAKLGKIMICVNRRHNRERGNERFMSDCKRFTCAKSRMTTKISNVLKYVIQHKNSLK